MDPVSSWIFAVLALFATIAIPFWVSRRENPRRLVAYDLEDESLLAHSAEGVGLSVQYNGATVEDPHVATLIVKSVGRADISSVMFDAGKSIVFTCSAPVVAELDNGAGESVPDFALRRVEGTNSFEVRPALMRKGARVQKRFLVDGDASLTVSSPLIDADLITQAARLKRARVRNRWINVPLFVIPLLSAWFLGWVVSGELRRDTADLIGFAAVGTGAVMLLILSVNRRVASDPARRL